MEHDKSTKLTVASFDPTVFGSKCLSDINSFYSINWQRFTERAVRLCRLHKMLKVPIVLCTAANIRKHTKAKCWPKEKAIYYDAHVQQAASPDSELLRRFLELYNQPLDGLDYVNYFQRIANIAKHELCRLDQPHTGEGYSEKIHEKTELAPAREKKYPIDFKPVSERTFKTKHGKLVNRKYMNDYADGVDSEDLPETSSSEDSDSEDATEGPQAAAKPLYTLRQKRKSKNPKRARDRRYLLREIPPLRPTITPQDILDRSQDLLNDLARVDLSLI